MVLCGHVYEGLALLVSAQNLFREILTRSQAIVCKVCAEINPITIHKRNII